MTTINRYLAIWTFAHFPGPFDVDPGEDKILVVRVAAQSKKQARTRAATKARAKKLLDVSSNPFYGLKIVEVANA